MATVALNQKFFNRERRLKIRPVNFVSIRPTRIYGYEKILLAEISLNIPRDFLRLEKRGKRLSGNFTVRATDSPLNHNRMATSEWKMKIYSNFYVEIEFNFA